LHSVSILSPAELDPPRLLAGEEEEERAEKMRMRRAMRKLVASSRKSLGPHL